jgi:hypothetical protein
MGQPARVRTALGIAATLLFLIAACAMAILSPSRTTMKLARFDDNRIGIVKDDQIFDVTDIVDGGPANGRP